MSKAYAITNDNWVRADHVPLEAQCVLPEELIGKAYKIIVQDILDEHGSPTGQSEKVAVLDEDAEAQRLLDIAAAELAATEKEELKKMAGRFNEAVRIKSKIALINKSKAMDTAQITAYLADPTIQQISMLLSEISFGTALQVLQASDVSAYYTAEEKQVIEDMISDYLTKEAE